MSLKFYYDLMSQPSRAVYIFLKANKIPFEDKPVALRKGEHLTEEYKKLNPFQKVPFIDDNGFILNESVAILKYLSHKFDIGDNWYPKSDLKRQAKVDEYMNWQHINTRLNAAMIFQHLLLLPRITGKPVQEKQMARFKKGLIESVGHIDKYFLGSQPFLCGDKLSVADLLGACELMQLHAVHEESFYTDNPVVKAWIERVRNRLAPHFDDAHKIIFRTRDIYPTLKAKL
ncbi:glutathione S-transferase theta-1 [Patella vulgata]|uniref:glutathione S-transferase theta-1 n=1 Tax=Patella vulgata TaxID=6465 RepID=UPI0024A9BFD8|nr:glutathione S-transferase theta-1 [Patella vulgata]